MIDAESFAGGVRAGNRTLLARAITLIESNAAKHAPAAEELIHRILPHAGGAIRVGITGVPGVGKSTFIESLGCQLCALGKKVAVLAVDPSSSVTGGSILGDKTRMERLSQEPNAFIRPSPTSGALGGVTRKSRETILLCEAAGFDVILVETVGVGQSETAVRSMVDFFLVLMLAGAGDELQGIKKGIVELADALVITKADGDNRLRAETARAELSRAIHYLTPPNSAWRPVVQTCSSREGTAIDEVWALIEKFQETGERTGFLAERRKSQTLDWIRETLREEVWRNFSHHPGIRAAWPAIDREVLAGKLSAAAATRQLLELVGRG